MSYKNYHCLLPLTERRKEERFGGGRVIMARHALSLFSLPPFKRGNPKIWNPQSEIQIPDYGLRGLLLAFAIQVRAV